MVLDQTMRLLRLLRRRDVVQLATGASVVVFASLFVLIGTAQPTAIRTSRRVVAKPTHVLSTQPVRPAAPVVTATTDCPQLDNPGGLRWRPAADAGPWPTNGSVSLPRFGVSAPIVKVGINTQAEMVVPRNARDVAWLDQGPYPGDTQNVVLAGHIRYSGVLGTFGRLQSAAPGDVVVVEMDGKRYEYRVEWACLFDRDTDLAEKIMGYTEQPSLTMISCGGVFDRAAGTHNKRVAVRATLVRTT